MEKHIKTLDIAMLLGAAAAIIIAVFTDFSAQCEKMEDSVFRLHILANSDSPFDQRIKYELRDYIIEDLGYIFEGAHSKNTAKAFASRSISLITERANSFLRQKGCDYEAYCVVGKSEFGTRKYGGYTLPAGEYDCLKIMLGKGEGKNWWCVLYPDICLKAVSDVKESPAFPTRTLYEKEKQSKKLTADSRKQDIEIRFAIYEWLKNIFR